MLRHGAMADLFDLSPGDADDQIERVLCVVAETHVYKIPPRQTSQGHRAADWNGNHLWTGRCRVVGKGEVCTIKLEDPNTGDLFAECPVTLPGPDQAPSVEPVMDSSRYFVLRIEDGSGARAGQTRLPQNCSRTARAPRIPGASRPAPPR